MDWQKAKWNSYGRRRVMTWSWIPFKRISRFVQEEYRNAPAAAADAPIDIATEETETTHTLWQARAIMGTHTAFPIFYTFFFREEICQDLILSFIRPTCVW